MQNTKVLNESNDDESSDSDVFVPIRKRARRKETNRFAYQTMHDERKRRKVDNAWYPVTLDEIKA